MDIKDKIKNIISKLPKSKSSFLLVIGIIGLLLILISSFDFSGKGNDETLLQSVSSVTNDEEYIEKLENKIENILSDMLGKTPVEVMITLESGTEYIYADETKVNADVTKDQSNLKLEQSDSNHKTYIIVKDAEGNEKPLIVTEKKPVIRGVVVVCESGETPTVSSAVRLAVKSAFNVDDEKICIIGRHI